MDLKQPKILKYDDSKHREQVISVLNTVFGYKSSHNQPSIVIDKKIAVSDGLFFIAELDELVIGTIMAGYDGHRGWIYSLAVLQEYQKTGIGSILLKHAENELINLGCLKINLQIMDHNKSARFFYKKHNYSVENIISMGKRIEENI